MKIGKKVQDAGKEVYFAVSNSDEFMHELGEFGMNVDPSKPTVQVSARDSRDRKYIMTEEFS